MEALEKKSDLREPKTTDDGQDTLTLYVKRKMMKSTSNSIWKVSFYILKYVHVIMLFTLLC